MTHAEVKRAAILVHALEEFSDLRGGIKEKTRPSGHMRLEIGAFEEQDGGGTGHGSIFVDVETGEKIIDFTERLIRAELRELGVV